MTQDEDKVEFTKNKRLIEKKYTGHVGGPMIKRRGDFFDSPKLNKHGMTEFE